ncbi:unnamed protein product [Peronospora farinosa]|uniref:Uncharacterized protein n=1 Tax=Peronospora farinosa TaxID=134698 RepID=A0AAV0TD48_9STRA|nr:unnamed protein product [Peronospora farinosa]CAI5717253.1 unnamed protein product [Peronospora farinosa]
MISCTRFSTVAKNGCVARLFSTSLAANTSESYSFVQSRVEYRNEIASLRKEFIKEEKSRREKLARDAEAQRQKILKAKAARLEIKRQQQVIRAKEVAREKTIHNEKVRKHFEEKVVVRQERNAEVERRREALVALLRQQSAKWTTKDNYTKKLKEEVFIYSPQQLSTRGSFDPSNTSGSAVSWLEKLQRMKPAGVHDTSDEAAASAVASAADEEATASVSNNINEDVVDHCKSIKKDE